MLFIKLCKYIFVIAIFSLILPPNSIAKSAPAGHNISKTTRELANSSNKAKLADFVNLIWQQSPVIAAARAKQQAAKAQANADSKWLYNPELSFDGDRKDNAADSKIFGLSQTIDINGKFLAAANTAKYEQMAAAAELADIRINIASKALIALAKYQEAKTVWYLSNERSELMQRFANLANKSFSAGDIDQSEYNLAQLALAEALIQHAEAERIMNESRLELVATIGFAPEIATGAQIAMYNGHQPLPELPKQLPAIKQRLTADIDKLVSELPAIKMLRARLEAAKANITKNQKQQLADPTISLRAGSDEGENLVGLSIALPINIINSYSDQVDVAKYSAAQYEQSLISALYAAKSRLKTSKRVYKLSKQAWETWQSAGASALEQQIDILDKKLKIGELSSTDYLVQIKQSINTEIAATKLFSQAWQAWFNWLRASGTTEKWLRGE